MHAWWNAFWLQLTGGGWRGPHVVAALLTGGAIAMTAEFVYWRFPVPAWRLAAACTAALLLGLNAVVFEFGTKAQAYGACTFLTVAAFRSAIARRALITGCLAGAAVGSSLLTAPACAVLLVWHCRQRSWRPPLAFLAGVIVPLFPVLVSLATAPDQTWFNLVGYHVLFRHVGWTGATEHDFEVLTSWARSVPALLVGLLAVAGLYFIHSEKGFARDHKAEFYLAGWMAVGLSVEAAVAHPTFPQYFIFVIPFLAILAAMGFCEVAPRLSLPSRWAVPVLGVLLLVGLANSLVETHDENNTWTGMDELARKVEQVTPADAMVLADPPVYFALRRLPPSGMEFPATHALELPEPMAAALHIVPQSVLKSRVRAGEFATVETCRGEEDDVRSLNLPQYYARSESIADCEVYWEFKK